MTFFLGKFLNFSKSQFFKGKKKMTPKVMLTI